MEQGLIADVQSAAHMKILGIDPGLNTTGYGILEIVDQRPRLIEAGIGTWILAEIIRNENDPQIVFPTILPPPPASPFQ